MASGKRGRPRKSISIFKDGSVSTSRPLTALSKAMKTGQRQFFLQLRRDYGAGPYLKNSTISALEAYAECGDPQSVILLQAQRELWEAREKQLQLSQSARSNRSYQIELQKAQIIAANTDLFERRNNKHSINSCAVILRKRLQHIGGDSWVPSLRTLHDWLSSYSYP